MMIDGSAIDMTSRHIYRLREEVSHLAIERRTEPNNTRTAAPPRSPNGGSRASAGPAPEQPTQDDSDNLDADTLLLKALVEALIGRKIGLPEVLRRPGQDTPAASPTANTAADTTRPDEGNYQTLTYNHTQIREYEATAVAISGTVVFTDANHQQQSLSVDLSIEMQRYFGAYYTELTVRQGRLTDPLVVTLDSGPTQLTDDRTPFDLDSDGLTELLPTLDSASAYLALDKNGDGAINNGAEMFGPQSGDGFAELAAYDQDGNGFIDAGDAVFSRLRLYRPGDGLQQSLADAHIGALYTRGVASPYTYTNSDNNTLGQLQTSGFYLRDDGSAGALQQLDLVT